MKIRSIEPTPSPNVMKLNMDERLPEGKNYQFTVKEKGTSTGISAPVTVD